MLRLAPSLTFSRVICAPFCLDDRPQASRLFASGVLDGDAAARLHHADIDVRGVVSGWTNYIIIRLRNYLDCVGLLAVIPFHNRFMATVSAGT